MPGEVLVTAQHLDDQCETFLLALKRGSGPTGLSAMAGESDFAGTKLLRPLLNESRDSLHRWAISSGTVHKPSAPRHAIGSGNARGFSSTR